MSIKNVGRKNCSESLAIATISLEVESWKEGGKKFDALDVIRFMETFCNEVPSERWHTISQGVLEKLEFWGVVEKVTFRIGHKGKGYI